MTSTSYFADVLEPFVERGEVAGAVVLVADKEAVLSLEAVGRVDIAANQAMPTDALFWIASQTKPMTATALMMLVDEGQVDVDDAVEKYLPEFQLQMLIVEQDDDHRLLRKPAHPITVRNVLNHTGGLRFQSPLEAPTLDGLPLRVAVGSYAMAPLEFEPDTRYQYSNAGTNTAGRIIEIVSGQPYEEWMQQRLLDPLGMTDTTFWPNAEQVARLAKSYRPNNSGAGLEETTISQLSYPLDARSRHPMPAGGLFSTISDVAQFCRLILNGGQLDGRRYLSEAAVRQMTSRQTRDGLESYGLGWATGEGWCGHGGAQSTNMTIDVRRGLITLFMVQHNGFPGEGAQSHGAFHQAAIARFGATRSQP